ncbi:MAG TPA: chemotaxis protein CheB [Hyphomicrobiales bacterium]|nr:chemotaxis protein CheB [Hyphomicrobiales bacterium]
MTQGNPPTALDALSDSGAATPLVVGIGVADDGLELLQQFLSILPESLSAQAFVVVQSANADYRGMLADLLGRHATLELATIDMPLVPHPGMLYLVRPHQHPLLQQGRLLSTLPEAGFDAGPINHFFSSLARHQGGHALALLLGDTAGDGCLGLREIEAAGGAVLLANAMPAAVEPRRHLLQDLLERFEQALRLREAASPLPPPVSRAQHDSQDARPAPRGGNVVSLPDDHFRRMADASPVLFLIANAQGELSWINHTWQQWSGRGLAQENGRRWLAHVHPEDRPQLEAGLRRQVAHGEDLALEYRLLNAQGDYGWLYHQSNVLRGAEGEVEGFIATCTDISWQKERTAEQQRIERKLEETARLDSLGLMAGGVAHDFNNLLTGILGNIELAQWETTADQHMLKTVLHDARSATLRAADLCKQMLAYSGKGQFISENCNVNHLVRETLRFIQSSLKHDIKISIELDEQLPPILADKVQLQQVVMNLTINASESIPERGSLWIRTGRTQLELETSGSLFGGEEAAAGPAIFIEVEDTGVGMTPEEARKAFEPFYSTKFIGRGLGLSAVQGIIKGHHGLLSVDSIKGKGTLMRVVLPLQQPGMPDPKPDPLQNDKSWINRVLIVDDEEIVAGILKRYLDHLCIESDYVLNGKECIARFQQNPQHYDLVILDLTMGGMDGYDTFRHLRRYNTQVPVVLISGFTEREATRLFNPEDLAGFLPKPISERALVDMIARLKKQG